MVWSRINPHSAKVDTGFGKRMRVNYIRFGSVMRRRARYNESPSASANSVSFCRIDTLPDGASSSGIMTASALPGIEIEDHRLDRTVSGCRQRQRPVAERDQPQRADRLLTPISPHSEADFFCRVRLAHDLAQRPQDRGRHGVERSETLALPRSTANRNWNRSLDPTERNRLSSRVHRA